MLHNEQQEPKDIETQYWEFDFNREHWLHYEGEFNMDHKDGFGTLYLANGDKFSGCFKNDAIEGFGSFFLAKEQKSINGIWAGNILKH